ncbi:MAG: ABC transporter substrate-binding protein [Usitatibacter sp.]
MKKTGFRALAAAPFLALCAMACLAQIPQDYPSGYRKLITSAQREGRVVIYSTMDFAEARPLIADFEALYPGIEVQYNEMNSPEVYGRFIQETERDGHSADVTWSSAMDLQIKLANDHFAEAYRSPEARFLPEWAVWHDEAYGTTFEPAVFVYNKKLVPPDEVPQTHSDFLRLLTSRPEKYSGNVITYDIEKSAVGFLFLSQDSLAMPGLWNLVSVLGARNVELEANTATMIERIASGKDLIGYNLLGSYALGRAKRDPSLGVVLPRDYTLVLSRVILIAKNARHPSAARLWLDFVLSRRGQTVLAERSRFFSIRPDVTGEFTAATLARTLGPSSHPIGVGSGLLVFLDKAKHQEIIRRWRQAIQQK